MPTCCVCGGPASTVTKTKMCPFCQVRNGRFTEKGWTPIPPMEIKTDFLGAETIEIGLQTEFIGLNGDYSMENEIGEEDGKDF